jgi:hypothetical protein
VLGHIEAENAGGDGVVYVGQILAGPASGVKNPRIR